MIGDQALRTLVADNAWLAGDDLEAWLGRLLPPRWIPRRLQIGLAADHRARLVVGPRQAGKSSLIWHELRRRREPLLWINCEEPSVAEWLRSPATVLADIARIAPAATTLFFEEVQRLPEAGLLLKGLVDRQPGLAIVATGSSSFELDAATRESLAGRAVRSVLLPLSLGEVLEASSGSPALDALRGRDEVGRHMVLGGYPAVVTAGEPRRELAGLVEAFVIRDASDRFRIRHPHALRQVLELAASQIGNLVSYNEWAGHAGIHATTVREYCALLQETHVLRLVRPFVGGKRAEIIAAPKAYFVDCGIRNQIFGGFGPTSDRADRGSLLENLVFGELVKSLNPLLDRFHYWRSTAGAEVDFVVVREGRLVAVEVKAGDPRGRLSRSARSFIDAYRPAAFIVVTSADRATPPPQQVAETPVRLVQPWQVADTLTELLDAAGGGGS